MLCSVQSDDQVFKSILNEILPELCDVKLQEMESEEVDGR